MVVAMFLEDVLADFGYQVVGVVSRLDEAMAHAPEYDRGAGCASEIHGPCSILPTSWQRKARLSSLPQAMANAVFRTVTGGARCCRNPSCRMI